MKTFLTLHAILTFYTFNLFAQWQPDVRLTNNTAASSTSFNNSWCIASSADFVHAVWYDLRDGNREIYYKRSADGGLSWGADTRLTNNPANSWYPSISVSGLVVHIVWQDNRDGNEEIYYKRSTDAGLSWGTDTRLTNNFGSSLSPSCAVSASEVHVVWYEDRDANNEIYHKSSSDGGVSWATDKRLTNDLSDSYGSTVSVSGLAVHVAWQDNRDSNYEIYHKRSTDGGISWGTELRLTNNSAFSRYPSLSATGSIVHILWEDFRGGNFNIYYKRSTDGGISWTVDTPITIDSADSYHPSLSVSGSVLHAVWHDNRVSNSNIYYKRSTDGGISWQADIPLTANFATAVAASVAVSGQVVHVIWYDNREGNNEIYYKRNPTGNSVGIININSEVPVDFLLLQNYPNPFNPTTKINFQLTMFNFVSLKVYDILGNEIESL
ncbi:MAG: sialidase family protein, partial [Ignavibacteria bacterium]